MFSKSYFLILLLGVSLFSLSVQAGDCLNIKTPSGAYGLSLQGHLVDGRPYGAAGLASLSKNQFSLNLTSSVGGVTGQSQIEGTVTLDRCELTLSGTGNASGFIIKGQLAERGDEILVTGISSAQPMVADGLLRPVGMSHCSNQSLKGNYTFASQGFVQGTEANAATWIPIGLVGSAKFNGKGCSFYQDTDKRANSISTSSGLLMYSVASDCSIHFIENGVPHSYGVLEQGGNEIVYVRVKEGTVRTGALSRVGSDSDVSQCP